MTTSARPSALNPDWTRYGGLTLEHRGVWALGVETVALNIEDSIFKAYTGTTVYVRYYSFFSWVFWALRQRVQSEGSTLTITRQREWLRRIENVLRSASLARSPSMTQLIGVERAVRIDELDPDGTIDTADDSAASAFTPAQYSASFQALGLGGSAGRGKPVGITPLAEKVAVAFDAQLTATRAARAARDILFSDRRRIPVSSVRALVDAMSIRPVAPGEPEHAALINVLFRLDEDPTDLTIDRLKDRARSRGLGLLLEIATQSAGEITESLGVRPLLCSGCFLGGRMFRVPSVYEEDFALLQRYEERQQVKLGLYGFWHEITRQLRSSRNHKASVGRILSQLVHLAGSSGSLKEWCGRNPLSTSVRKCLERIEAKHAEFDRREVPLGFQLTEQIRNRETTATERIGGAILALLLSVVQWRQLSGRVGVAQSSLAAHRRGLRARISLATLAEDTIARGDLQLSEYIKWVATSLVLGQSLQVATAKLRRGEFRYFIVREDDGYQLVREQRSSSYLIYDGSRIRSGYALLTDLSLVSWENGLRSTVAGRKLMERVRAHHDTLPRSA